MSFTGRFNPDFRRESDLPYHDLPRETNEERAERLALEERVNGDDEDE